MIILCLIGKHEWTNLRGEALLADNNTVMKQCDCVKVLKAYFDMEIHSGEFGFNPISLKNLVHVIITINITMMWSMSKGEDWFHSLFSDNSDNNAVSIFKHMKISFTVCMRTNFS